MFIYICTFICICKVLICKKDRTRIIENYSVTGEGLDRRFAQHKHTHIRTYVHAYIF